METQSIRPKQKEDGVTKFDIWQDPPDGCQSL